jgi:hypothetical protein
MRREKGNKKERKDTRNALLALASADYQPPQLCDYQAEAGSGPFRSETKFGTLINNFPNINNSDSPFSYKTGKYMDCQEAIQLCVKAYWAFPLLRNVVEILGELSNSKVFLKGGNKKTRDFLNKWLQRINIWHVKEQFFREWFRSANCFIYRLDGVFSADKVAKMTQVFGAEQIVLPLKYILLNPEFIRAGGNLMFGYPEYYKILNAYELQRVKTPNSEDAKLIKENFSEQEVDQIKKGGTVALKLNPEKLSVLLYKAQSYEPMGVPLAYGVLEDIEAKLELKRIDLSMARTTDRAMLHITVGTPAVGDHPAQINPKTIASIQAIFQNPEIARVLVTDFTVGAEWKVPDLKDILGAAKYEQLDKDISQGLNAIIFDSGEKFANTSIKINIFIERLKEARNAFITQFLQPEIVRVCQAIGAKNYPEAFFEEISLKDELQYQKIYVQMAQLGLLTPDELYEAMESGSMPTPEESIEHQKAFKELKDEGYYMPLIGGATKLQEDQIGVQEDQLEVQRELGHAQIKQKAQQAKIKTKAPGAKGRPTCSKSPKSTTKRKPIGQSRATSLAKIQEIFPHVNSLQNKVDETLREYWKIEQLTEVQNIASQSLVEAIISNEEMDNWETAIATYIKEPKELNEVAEGEITELQLRFNTTSYEAAILRLAQIECPTETSSQ